MKPPPVLYNTYVQTTVTPYIDIISKVYLMCVLMFGLNRLPIFGNVRLIFVVLALVYSALLQILVVYMVIEHNVLRSDFNFGMVIRTAQFLFCLVFSFISWKRMQLYYCELNKFDMEVGCRPCIPKGSIKNAVFLILTLVILMILFLLPYQVPQMRLLFTPMLLLHIHDIFEIYYYGHLLNLLIPRLQLINYFMELSLSNVKDTTGSNIKGFTFFKRDVINSNCEMKKLMDLFHTVIKAYDFLMEAIKWQLLLMLMNLFITILSFSYRCSYRAIRNMDILQSFVTDFGVSLTILLPLFSPCFFGDRIHNEVRRLRELLASRLYENKLDKTGRSTARALLAFTETRNLSFTLLRMLKIDISLPFKVVGLIITYLIILLQFEKVMNP